MATESVVRPSAVSTSVSRSGAKTSAEALSREMMHNLQYQHHWTDIRLHTTTPTANPSIIDITLATPPPFTPMSDKVFLISGLPPRHSYVHPDLLNHLVKNKLEEKDVQIQREWVLPLSTGETYSLRKFCQVFDHLPPRPALEGVPQFKHQDAKRVLCGIKAHDGMGGDGTMVYYIMQEGEVKPRQN